MREGKEQDKIVIYTVDGCEVCEELKDKLDELGDSENVEVVELDAEKAEELVEEGVIDDNEKVEVPLAVTESGKKCEIFFDDDVVLAQCEGEDELRVLSERKKDEDGDEGVEDEGE